MARDREVSRNQGYFRISTTKILPVAWFLSLIHVGRPISCPWWTSAIVQIFLDYYPKHNLIRFDLIMFSMYTWFITNHYIAMFSIISSNFVDKLRESWLHWPKLGDSSQTPFGRSPRPSWCYTCSGGELRTQAQFLALSQAHEIGLSIDGDPKHGWFIREIPTKMDDLGVPRF